MEQIQLYPSPDGDDTDRLQAAIDSANSLGQELHLAIGKYRISQPLVLNHRVAIIGQKSSGWNTVQIEAIAPVERILEVRAVVHLSDLHISGGSHAFGAPRFARHGLWLAGCGPSHFERVHASYCLVDGWHFAADGINDRGTFRDVSGASCGILHLDTSLVSSFPQTSEHMRHAGSFIASAAGGLLTCSSAQFMSWGVRRGDPILIGDQLTVVSAVHSEATLSTATQINASGLPIAVGVGSGWHEERHGDNNLNNVYSGIFARNAAHGMALDGLHGPVVVGAQFDYNAFHGVRVGVQGGAAVLSPSFVRCYFEGNGRRSFLLGGTQGISIISPSFHATQAGQEPWEYVGGPSSASGMYQGPQAFGPIGGAHLVPSRFPSLVVGDPHGGSESHGLLQTMGRQMLPSGAPGFSYTPGGKIEPRDNLMIIVSESTDTTVAGLAGYHSDPSKPLSGHPTVTLIGGGPKDILFTSSGTFKLSTSTLRLKPLDTLTVAYFGYSIWVETSRSVA